MRIISGSLKGRRIRFSKNIRPTQNKVRKAIFDCLGDFVKGSIFLELFAGSGAVGIEAFSYGAKEVSFVEQDSLCLRLIESNLKLLGLESYRLYRKDSMDSFDFLSKKRLRFDIIFLDPPYLKDLAKNSLLSLSACDIVAAQGVVVLEHHKREELPREAVGNGRDRSLLLFKQKRYGDKVLSFFRRETSNQKPE